MPYLSDGYYLWTPNDPESEVGARPIEIYRDDLYAVDTKTKCNKDWCIENGTFVPLIPITVQYLDALVPLLAASRVAVKYLSDGDEVRAAIQLWGAMHDRLKGIERPGKQANDATPTEV